MPSSPLSPLDPNVANTMVSDYLSCIQVVMVNTTLPANIGSAARAMHTMGLSRLTVIDPKLPIDDTSIAHAAGGSDILTSATISPTLSSALTDCQLVFAASSRSRHLPRPIVNPTQAAQIMLHFIDSQNDFKRRVIKNHEVKHTAFKPQIAILFGREDRGLTNEELAFADYHIQIDANPAYPVLNVASAVQVIASFIFTHIQSHVAHRPDDSTPPAHSSNQSCNPIEALPILNTYVRQQWDEPAITQQQLQQLTERVTTLMVKQNLADNDHLKSLPLRLSRLGSRLQLDQKEYQLLSALLAKLLKQ